MGNYKKKDRKSHDTVSSGSSLNKFYYDALSRTLGNYNSSSGVSVWSPSVDIYESTEAIMLVAEIPGLNEGDFKIEIKGNVLILKGRRAINEDLKEENFHRIERYYGLFERRFNLPGTIVKSEVSADYKDGLLEVKIPKVEEKNKKIIKVNVLEK